jgi:hypothetical protein
LIYPKLKGAAMKRLSEIGVTKVEDVKNVTGNDTFYVLSSIFNTNNKVSKRLLERKLKVLNGIEPFLMKVINDDEKVYYLSYGIKNSTFDHMFLGGIAYYINRKIFVFTTKRILMIKYRGKFKPAELYSEIPYQHIVKVKSTLLGNISLHFSDSRKELFTGIPKADRRFINNIFAKLKENGIAGKEIGSVLNLCPHCFERVDGFPHECSKCHGKFKSPNKTALLSLIFPGIGDIYLGHKGFGVLQVVGGLLVWLSFIIPQAATATSEASSPTILGALILFVAMHGIDSLVTMNTAKKGIYP